MFILRAGFKKGVTMDKINNYTVNLENFRAERLKKSEELLRLSGCEKCNQCNCFMDKELVNKDNLCSDCR